MMLNGRRHHRRLQFHGLRLPDPPGAPRSVLGELHYLYSLLVFSDAEPVKIGWSPGTECGRVEYQRDGKPWVMVIRQGDPPDADHH